MSGSTVPSNLRLGGTGHRRGREGVEDDDDDDAVDVNVDVDVDDEDDSDCDEDGASLWL